MTESPEEQVSKFLKQQLPQIQMHGGAADIMTADPDEGNVYIVLGGACQGCGLSPMTTEAIKRRMPEEIEWAENVTIEFTNYF